MQAKELINRLGQYEPETEVGFFFTTKGPEPPANLFLIAVTKEKTPDGKPIAHIVMKAEGEPKVSKFVASEKMGTEKEGDEK